MWAGGNCNGFVSPQIGFVLRVYEAILGAKIFSKAIGGRVLDLEALGNQAVG